MTETEIVAVVLLTIICLLVVVAGVLMYPLFARLPKPQPATASPLPMIRREERGGTTYRSLTPSSLARLPTRRPASSRPAPAPGPAAHLTIHTGPLQGSRIPVARPMLALGRSARCDITLPDPQASRQHARLEWRHDGLYLLDTNSTNGTYVNGYRIGQVRLRGGEQVQISNTVLTIQLR